MPHASLNVPIKSWSANLRSYARGDKVERSLSCEGPIARPLQGISIREGNNIVTPTGFAAMINRTFVPYEERLTEAGGIKLGPSVLDVAAEQQKPSGSIYCSEGLFAITLYPGEEIFDELWSRHALGGRTPEWLSFSIVMQGGQPWEQLNWDIATKQVLPIFGLGFTSRENLA